MENDESSIRKLIWERKGAVDDKMSDPGFLELPVEEQDAWILALQLGLSHDAVADVLGGKSGGDVTVDLLRDRIAEAFRFGKRKALRELKNVLSRHAELNVPKDAESED